MWTMEAIPTVALRLACDSCRRLIGFRASGGPIKIPPFFVGRRTRSIGVYPGRAPSCPPSPTFF